MYSLRRTEGWYEGRPVAAGSTPSKLISAKSSASTNTSITRTGLLSSMKSSRHSGNSVHCPRSACSTKRLINSPIESRENHNSSTAFSHSQGQFRKSALVTARSALPPGADIVSLATHVRFAKSRHCQVYAEPHHVDEVELIGLDKLSDGSCQW